MLLLVFVPCFLFLSLRLGPKMQTSTKGRNMALVCQLRLLMATTEKSKPPNTHTHTRTILSYGSFRYKNTFLKQHNHAFIIVPSEQWNNVPTNRRSLKFSLTLKKVLCSPFYGFLWVQGHGFIKKEHPQAFEGTRKLSQDIKDSAGLACKTQMFKLQRQSSKARQTLSFWRWPGESKTQLACSSLFGSIEERMGPWKFWQTIEGSRCNHNRVQVPEVLRRAETWTGQWEGCSQCKSNACLVKTIMNWIQLDLGKCQTHSGFGRSDWCGCTGGCLGVVVAASRPSLHSIPRLPLPSEVPPMPRFPHPVPGCTFPWPSPSFRLPPLRLCYFFFPRLLPELCHLPYTARWGWGTWHGMRWVPCIERSGGNLADTGALWMRRPPHTVLGGPCLGSSMKQVAKLRKLGEKHDLGGKKPMTGGQRREEKNATWEEWAGGDSGWGYRHVPWASSILWFLPPKLVFWWWSCFLNFTRAHLN